MSYHLSPLTTKDEMASLVKTEHLAYATPYNSFWEILKGPSEEKYTERNWSGFEKSSNSKWVKVTKDGDDELVVGAAEWVVHEKNPFDEKALEIPTATWWPEGPLRSISDQMLNQFFRGRPAVMNRPHLLLSICFVHPSHRRQGIGRLLLEYGCQIADSKNLECFVEASPDGVALYKAHGFVVVHPFYLEADDKVGDAEWMEVKKKVTPEPYCVWLMWRPKGGKFVEGTTKFSWEE